MKTLLLKLVPGILATLATIAIGAFAVHAQSTPAAAAPLVQQVQPAPQAQPVQAPEAPYMICGVCGARIAQPQTVLVAPAYYNTPAAAPAPRQAYYVDNYAPQPVTVVRGPNGYYLADDCADYGCRIPPAPVFSLTDYGRADPRLIRREARNDRRSR